MTRCVPSLVVGCGVVRVVVSFASVGRNIEWCLGLVAHDRARLKGRLLDVVRSSDMLWIGRSMWWARRRTSSRERSRTTPIVICCCQRPWTTWTWLLACVLLASAVNPAYVVAHPSLIFGGGRTRYHTAAEPAAGRFPCVAQAHALALWTWLELNAGGIRRCPQATARWRTRSREFPPVGYSMRPASP